MVNKNFWIFFLAPIQIQSDCRIDSKNIWLIKLLMFSEISLLVLVFFWSKFFSVFWFSPKWNFFPFFSFVLVFFVLLLRKRFSSDEDSIINLVWSAVNELKRIEPIIIAINIINSRSIYEFDWLFTEWETLISQFSYFSISIFLCSFEWIDWSKLIFQVIERERERGKTRKKLFYYYIVFFVLRKESIKYRYVCA